MKDILLYSILLFFITVIGGTMPLWRKATATRDLKPFLAFSGAFLLGVTLLHLAPENFEMMGRKAGVLMLIGFFLQQIFQRLTHGMEHGHSHTGDHHHNHAYMPILLGLSLHAFTEGLPLGIVYVDNATLPSLYAAVAFHKLPEALLLATMVLSSTNNRSTAIWISILFAMVTPLASLLSYYIGTSFVGAGKIVEYIIPIVAGSFIHIATTIFFESGTSSHEMNYKKWLAILLGLGFALLTLLGTDTPHLHQH